MPEFKLSEKRQNLINTLVEKLPELRKSCSMSQYDLAQKIGKSRQTVSDIERKKAPLGWDTYLAIVFVFNMYKANFNSFNEGQFSEVLKNEIFN